MIRHEINENKDKDDYLLKYDIFRTYPREFFYIAQRTLCNVVRNPALLTSQIISVIIYGLFTGLIFNKLEETVEPGIYNRFGAIFFIISCQVLGATSALEPLINERALFIHVKFSIYLYLDNNSFKLCLYIFLLFQENVSGYYRVSSFFLAKLFIDLPLVHVIPSIIYTVITFFMTGLRRSFHHFFIFLITNLMAKIFGSAMCYFVAASTSTLGKT